MWQRPPSFSLSLSVSLSLSLSSLSSPSSVLYATRTMIAPEVCDNLFHPRISDAGIERVTPIDPRRIIRRMNTFTMTVMTTPLRCRCSLRCIGCRYGVG